jgi:hypothetical protein
MPICPESTYENGTEESCEEVLVPLPDAWESAPATGSRSTREGSPMIDDVSIPHLTRRRFVRAIGLSAAASLLAACAPGARPNAWAGNVKDVAWNADGYLQLDKTWLAQ